MSDSSTASDLSVPSGAWWRLSGLSTLAFSLSASAPAVAGLARPGVSLADANAMAMMAFCMVLLAVTVRSAWALARSGAMAGGGSLWGPAHMVLAVAWILPVAASGASLAQLAIHSVASLL